MAASGGKHNEREWPLTGRRLLDLASFTAGPVAATVMGDYGSKVIKIEPPGAPAKGGFYG